MKARDLMTPDVERVGERATLSDVAGLMWTLGLGAVVVVDAEQRPVGVVSDRDVAMAAFLGGRKLADILVSDTVQRDLPTCTPDDSLGQVAHLMTDRKARRVVVVDQDGRAIGLVSVTDLARAVSRWMGLLDAPMVIKAVEAAGNHPKR